MGTVPALQSVFGDSTESSRTQTSLDPSAPPLDGMEGPPPYEDMRKLFNTLLGIFMNIFPMMILCFNGFITHLKRLVFMNIRMSTNICSYILFVAPPSYEESVFGRVQIANDQDGEDTPDCVNFAPVYPVYHTLRPGNVCFTACRKLEEIFIY